MYSLCRFLCELVKLRNQKDHSVRGKSLRIWILGLPMNQGVTVCYLPRKMHIQVSSDSSSSNKKARCSSFSLFQMTHPRKINVDLQFLNAAGTCIVAPYLFWRCNGEKKPVYTIIVASNKMIKLIESRNMHGDSLRWHILHLQTRLKENMLLNWTWHLLLSLSFFNKRDFYRTIFVLSS